MKDRSILTVANSIKLVIERRNDKDLLKSFQDVKMALMYKAPEEQRAAWIVLGMWCRTNVAENDCFSKDEVEEISDIITNTMRYHYSSDISLENLVGMLNKNEKHPVCTNCDTLTICSHDKVLAWVCPTMNCEMGVVCPIKRYVC